MRAPLALMRLVLARPAPSWQPMAEIQIEKNNEEWELAAKLDNGLPRTLYRVTECPFKEGCSKSSFFNGRAWSWESEQKARNYLARHLHVSQLHKIDIAGACMAASVAVVEETVETHEERETTRMEAVAAKNAKKAKEDANAAADPDGMGADGAEEDIWDPEAEC